MASSVSYKQYYYALKYHGKIYSGKVAAVNDLDAEREVRQDVGWQKYSFSSSLRIKDSEGNEVMARGNLDELTLLSGKPKASNYPKYSLTEM